MDKQPHSSASSQPDARALPPGKPIAAKVPVTSSATAKLESARVLVVNGLIGSAEMIEPYATASGINCLAFARGRSALTAMKQAAAAGKAFHVAFVERVLPDIDAYEFAALASADENLAATKLILVSTFGTGAAEGQKTAKLFFAHVARPTRQIEVLNAVQAGLSGNADILRRRTKSIALPAASTGRPMILIAEDSPVTQMMVLLQLKESGFYAQIVTNGVEAVEAAKTYAFDAILMDCQMPVMDGFAASQSIRQWERQTGKARIPIIAMTAYTSEYDMHRCLQSGMDDYMSKPVTYEKLDAVLSKWLNFTLSLNTEDAMDKNNIGRSRWDEPQPSAPPVDSAGLTEMLGSAEAEEILQLFVTSTSELLDKIEEALHNHNLADLQESAHTLKGASSSIGAHALWQAAIELERAAKNGEWQRLPEVLNGVRATFEQAKSFISNRL
jgi:CheY-like chemotaxis protein